MNYRKILAADLNLLAVFQALMEERGISKAAKKVHLTQSAMSRAFQRLQHLFKDELLIRSERIYSPTRRAIQIKRELDFIFPRLEILLQADHFRPEQYKGTFRIAATDYAATVIVPRVIRLLREEAPHVGFHLMPLNSNTLPFLESNSIDLVLYANKCPSHLRSEFLFLEKMSCVVKKDHPLCKKKMTLKNYLSYFHIAISLLDNSQETVDLYLESNQLSRLVRIRTPYIISAALLANEGDLVLTVPSRIVPFMNFINGIIEIPAPTEIPPLKYIQIWHPRSDQDPLSIYIRSIIKKITREFS